jgi:hypothetical protein
MQLPLAQAVLLVLQTYLMAVTEMILFLALLHQLAVVVVAA